MCLNAFINQYLRICGTSQENLDMEDMLEKLEQTWQHKAADKINFLNSLTRKGIIARLARAPTIEDLVDHCVIVEFKTTRQMHVIASNNLIETPTDREGTNQVVHAIVEGIQNASELYKCKFLDCFDERFWLNPSAVTSLKWIHVIDADFDKMLENYGEEVYPFVPENDGLANHFGSDGIEFGCVVWKFVTDDVAKYSRELVCKKHGLVGREPFTHLALDAYKFGRLAQHAAELARSLVEKHGTIPDWEVDRVERWRSRLALTPHELERNRVDDEPRQEVCVFFCMISDGSNFTCHKNVATKRCLQSRIFITRTIS